MFKKGVITDEISQDFNEAVELALKYNLDGVEIRSVWEKGPHELDSVDINKIKEILAKTNLQVCGISAPFFKCDIDNEEEIKEHLEILKKSIKLGQELGTNLIRGFTFWDNGNFEENLDKIISKFEEPLEILEREKAILVLEFDPSVYATNAKKLVKVIDKINSPYVKALWDPGNDIYDPEGEEPYPTGYEIIKNHMIHMHLKDAKKLDDGSVVATPIGEGEVKYKEHFERIINEGYSGYVVLETHYRPKHELSEELLALPKGSAFSHLGYEATEESLINWDKILKG